MDSKLAEQILDELSPTFEAIESRSDAILKFLKDKKLASEEQLAPYLEQAAAASSVKWRALRVRMGRLFALAEKSEAERTAKEAAKQMQDEKAEDDKKAQASAKKTLEQAAQSGNQPAEAGSGPGHKQEEKKQAEPGSVTKNSATKEESRNQTPGRREAETTPTQSATGERQENTGERKQAPEAPGKSAA